MGLPNPADRRLYQRWIEKCGGLTNAQVAAAMTGITEEAVRRLRLDEPSRLVSRTRELMRAWVDADDPAMADPIIGSAIAGSPRSPSGLADSARVWVQWFLLKLTEAKCLEEEVDEARVLLTRSDIVTYAHGGRPGQAALTPDQQLQLVKTIAEVAIIPRLKEAGRKVNASWTR